MLESYHKLQQKPKTVPEFKNALQIIWSALPEKATDNSVNDYQFTYRILKVIFDKLSFDLNVFLNKKYENFVINQIKLLKFEESY